MIFKQHDQSKLLYPASMRQRLSGIEHPAEAMAAVRIVARAFMSYFPKRNHITALDTAMQIRTDTVIAAKAATTIEPVSFLGLGGGFTSENRFCSWGWSLLRSEDDIVDFLPVNRDTGRGGDTDTNFVVSDLYHTNNDLLATVTNDDALVLLP